MNERFSSSVEDESWHDWLVIVPKEHGHAAYISDIAGYDPIQVDMAPEAIVPAVMSWLATRPHAGSTPTPNDVLTSLPDFASAAENLRRSWHGHEPWAMVVHTAIHVARASANLKLARIVELSPIASAKGGTRWLPEPRAQPLWSRYKEHERD